MKRYIKMLAAAFTLIAIVAACGPTNVLIRDQFLENDKRVLYIIEPVAVGQENTLYNFKIRICDLDDKDNNKNCQTTTVLENVHSSSIDQLSRKGAK